MTKRKKTSSTKQAQYIRKKPVSTKNKSTKKVETELQENQNVTMTVSQNTEIYTNFANGIVALLEEARHLAARSVNAILTATYWEMGRRIVEIEQNGKIRAEYGTQLLLKLSQDLTTKFGRGFSVDNLQRMRLFFLAYPDNKIYATVSRKFDSTQILSASKDIKIGKTYTLRQYLLNLSQCFPLSWSHYIRLLAVKTLEGRKFYETEAIRGGWSVRQLDRQISTLFYERTALSKDKAAMLTKGAKPKPEDIPTPEEEIKDPTLLEFLNLKDEYSEHALEEALIEHLESFLLELGNDFCFVGRQKRLRIGNEWYRVDLLFFHRRLKCLVIIDLKLGKFTHADVGQMHLYLNYAKEQWTHSDENPPIGLILCAQKDEAIAHYTLNNLPNKVLAAEYKTVLPEEKLIAQELERTREILKLHKRKRSIQTQKVANGKKIKKSKKSR